MATLNIRKLGEDCFVTSYDGDTASLEMSQADARGIMRLALLAEVQVRFQNLGGDELINFMHGDSPPQSADELLESYRQLSCGRPFAIHAWSPMKDGV